MERRIGDHHRTLPSAPALKAVFDDSHQAYNPDWSCPLTRSTCGRLKVPAPRRAGEELFPGAQGGEHE